MNPVTLQPAYLLHHRVFRDTSLIVDLITPEHGRISAVARGARSAKSRRRVLLQPFRPLLASWTGRSELRTLTTVEESGLPKPLEGRRLACAYYATELALRLVPTGQPNDAAFAFYVQVLELLVTADTLESTLRNYELDLLDALGLLPDLSRCDVAGDAVSSDVDYQFDAVAGVATRSDGSAVPTIGVAGKTLLAMHDRTLVDPDILKQAKRLMRAIIAVHLGGKPLQSRALFTDASSGHSAGNSTGNRTT